MQTFISDMSGKSFPSSEKVHCRNVSKNILELVRKDHPHVTPKSHLAVSELNEYRQKYLEHLFAREIGELTEMEKMVLEKLKEHETLTDKLDGGDNPANLSYGQRLADKIATFGGSWTFIIMFLVFILVWMGINIYWLANRAFDPYPFILLNLILSCLAALQAPVIMMSQNRQEEKDRQRAKNDYMINLKSELEVRILHEKIDHLILHQQQDMMEIQQTQLEMLNEVNQALKKIAGSTNNHKHTNGDPA
ncbi:DUF1003 domain-containing protein [Chitinophaga filiformis]|uniref:DUF1003 domain-containing protein n=1 Tax=Chitinophaga filiformis TaxID=104663 RepID=A0ABY4I6Z6_CHIFI|nr:DUF1003 domain-containing protein [Chitinophaga filiformis]UPK70883.1 DUF1003 domain-containing protein [Chitinophaga filiformis]